MVHGRHWLPKAASVVVNCAFPLDERFTELNVWPYRLKGKGSDSVVMQSSQWLPMSVVPGTIVPVVCVMAISQGDGVAVTVGVGEGVALAVGVGVTVTVGVGVGLPEGVGVGVPPVPPGACTPTAIGEPVLKKPTIALVAPGG